MAIRAPDGANKKQQRIRNAANKMTNPINLNTENHYYVINEKYDMEQVQWSSSYQLVPDNDAFLHFLRVQRGSILRDSVFSREYTLRLQTGRKHNKDNPGKVR